MDPISVWCGLYKNAQQHPEPSSGGACSEDHDTHEERCIGPSSLIERDTLPTGIPSAFLADPDGYRVQI